MVVVYQSQHVPALHYTKAWCWQVDIHQDLIGQKLLE
jgi:hypothetical protein